MADKWPLANGNWSNAANWNGGTKPVAGDDVYADGKTVTVDEDFDVATLRTTQRSGGTIGGTFNFNTAGVTGTVTSSSPLVPGATNMVQITATTGTVTLSLGGNVVFAGFSTCILHTGNCNFILSGTNFINNTSGGNSGRVIISKTSAGLITITGNLTGGDGASGGFSGNHAFSSTNGNSIIIGNITGGGSNSGINGNNGVNQTAGTLTITGNITGGLSSSALGINFSGTIININGTVLGGNGGAGLTTSATTNNITGNVTAGTVAAITSSSANQIQVTGDVTASASAVAISMTNANGQVYLNGNMVNNNGKMAIFAPIVWLDKNNTTSAAFFTSGGGNRTLYSADTMPNQPAQNNVRFNTVYGPGNSLTGTCVMPTAANSRNGVVYDNGTVGTALFTTSLFLTEINASSDPVAVRLKNAATPDILGELMEAYKKS